MCRHRAGKVCLSVCLLVCVQSILSVCLSAGLCPGHPLCLCVMSRISQEVDVAHPLCLSVLRPECASLVCLCSPSLCLYVLFILLRPVCLCSPSPMYVSCGQTIPICLYSPSCLFCLLCPVCLPVHPTCLLCPVCPPVHPVCLSVLSSLTACLLPVCQPCPSSLFVLSSLSVCQCIW